MFYHASNTGNIKELRPNVSNHNKPLVYLTTKRENSLVYLSNAVEKYCKETGFPHEGSYYKFCSYGFTKEGILELQEYWPDAVKDTYAGVEGYIYSMVAAPQAEAMKDIPFAATSELPVEVDACEYVPDAYEALLEAADKGRIIIRSYSDNSEQKLEWIKRCINSEYVKAQEIPEYKAFLEAKFGDSLQK